MKPTKLFSKTPKKQRQPALKKRRALTGAGKPTIRIAWCSLASKTDWSCHRRRYCSHWSWNPCRTPAGERLAQKTPAMNGPIIGPSS